MTISASGVAYMEFDNVDGFNLNGQVVSSTEYGTVNDIVYTFTFDQAINMGEIELVTTTTTGSAYPPPTVVTFTANGQDINADIPSAIAGDNAIKVGLDSFTNITSFTMTSADPVQFYFDEISFTTAVADNPPVFTTVNGGNIDETSISGLVVLADSDVEANDGDGGGIDSVTYSIVGGTGEDYFDINASNGEVTLNAAGEAALDFENNQSYTLTLRANDGNSSTDETVTIAVNDIAPAITTGQVFSVKESDDNSTVLGTVATTGDDPVNYSIESGNTGNAFTIDGTTGEIILSDTSQLDASATGSYTLSVQ
ncbi:cadherin repeat domain-containing protein, partial [Vreelandella titanicae]